MSFSSRAIVAFSALALALLLAGCDSFENESSDPPLEGQYDLEGSSDITAGQFEFEGQLTLQRNSGELSAQGQFDVFLDGDSTGTWQVEDVIGATYDHPSVTMIWDMNDPGGASPSERDDAWSFDGEVSPNADTIEGIVQIEGVRGGSISLIRQ
jgi:hypothetical protein